MCKGIIRGSEGSMDITRHSMQRFSLASSSVFFAVLQKLRIVFRRALPLATSAKEGSAGARAFGTGARRAQILHKPDAV